LRRENCVAARAPFRRNVPDSAARVLGVIPARLASERLPRKPLYPLAGRPLIEWVWRRVSSFTSADAWVVATESWDVAETCRSLGAPVVMTSEAHGSGTERVAEVVQREEYHDFGIVVNVQGDEPFIEEEHVRVAVEQVRAGWSIGTVATPVRSLDVFQDPAVVKLTRRSDGAALYFSRSAIPFRRDGEPSKKELGTELYLRHVGVYAYTREALLTWVLLPPSELEGLERLEQLRPLSAGLAIGVGIVSAAERGVDTREDASRAERRLRALAYDGPPTR
jgi:3-deoxy-manno-octulosonate cytidylyltransferase (CMP-KDO synthetase)